MEATMVETIEAIYDGEALPPENPLALEPNTRVRVTVETLQPHVGGSTSFLDTARSLNLDGPPDWAENIDSYLCGGGRFRMKAEVFLDTVYAIAPGRRATWTLLLLTK
jgi:hypothetical protein